MRRLSILPNSFQASGKSMLSERETPEPRQFYHSISPFVRIWSEQRNVCQHSWYFRNALVRANYRNINKDIEYSPIYLVRFFRNLLLGESWVLKNRYLHIDPTDEWKVQPRLATPQVPHTPHQKVDRKGGQKTEKVGRKGGQKTKESILSLIASDPFVTTNEMSKRWKSTEVPSLNI